MALGLLLFLLVRLLVCVSLVQGAAFVPVYNAVVSEADAGKVGF